VNLFGFLFLSIVRSQLSINLLGALHTVHYRRKVYQEGVTDSLDDRAVMFGDSLLGNLVRLSGSRSVRTSLLPIWRLNPTMSVNMIAASRRVSIHYTSGVFFQQSRLFCWHYRTVNCPQDAG
jgi:hypothetical protein